jgi:hypothetical protein
MTKDFIVEVQRAYGAQRDELIANGRTEYVSGFDILTDKEGVSTSYCVWPEDVPTLLPQSELIAFTGLRNGKRWYLFVPFDVGAKICGLLMIDGLSPPRYDARSWPDSARMSELVRARVMGDGPPH